MMGEEEYSNTSALGPPDGSALNLEDQIQRGLDFAQTFLREDPSERAAKNGVQIFVISSGDIDHWPGAKLNHMHLNTIFDEVSTRTSRNGIQKIKFSLSTGKVEDDLPYQVKRGDVASFEAVMQEFKSRMNYLKDLAKRKEKREPNFKIHLEPDPEQGGAKKSLVAQVSESDEESF